MGAHLQKMLKNALSGVHYLRISGSKPVCEGSGRLSEGSTLLPCPLVNTLQVVGKERHDNEHRARVDDIGLEVPGR